MSLKKETLCMVLPLLSRMNLEQIAGSITKFVSKQACNWPLTILYLQLFWEHVLLH